jgi:hypothetical protein
MPTEVTGWVVDSTGAWQPKRLTFPEKLSGDLVSAFEKIGYEKSSLEPPGTELLINNDPDGIAGPYVLLVRVGGIDELVTADDLAGLTHALERLEALARLI